MCRFKIPKAYFDKIFNSPDSEIGLFEEKGLDMGSESMVTEVDSKWGRSLWRQ